MAYQTEIERALNEIISLQEWLKFQNLAVILAQQKWPQLVASEPNWDRGLDGHASGCLASDGQGIGLACSLTATLGKIESDATKVVANYPDVRVLIFATPEAVTKHTEGLWAAEILAKFGLQLVVVPRAQFIAWLQEPTNSNICKEQFGIEPAMAPRLAPDLGRSLEAASEIAANWDRTYRRVDRPVISLNAVKLNEKGEPIEAVTTASLKSVLSEGQRIVLEAPAGSGKTTTLIQLARHALGEGRLAFLVDLPEWVRSGKDIFSYIAERPQFASRDVDATLLAKLRGDQPPIFLLNGWNEVPVAGAEAADTALRELDRSFFAAIVIVATRKHSVVPQLRGSSRLELNPLRRAQRDEYLRLALGGSAHDLRVKLNNSRVLDSITRTPLFLAEVVDLYRAGKDIPATKMGVLGAVMDAIEHSLDHRTSLGQGPLRGHAREYLRLLSMEMTGRGETAIVEADALAVMSSVGARLRAAHQIGDTPDPREILDELSKRHVLVRAEDGEISFRFQHQQFQEFFAAGGLGARLGDLVRANDSKEDRTFLVSYVNEPRWGESLRMLAEDIGASCGKKAMAGVGAKLVRMALEVDPIFAAELSRWCGPSVWTEVREEMGGRLRAWYEMPDGRHKQCALAAMLETGSDDFKDIVVPLLTDPNDQVRLAVYHSRAELLPSSLGPRWVEIVQGWPEDARLNFLLQLGHDPWSADSVEQLALADSSPQIKWNAARQLSWYGFTEKVEKLLGPLDDNDFRTALRSLDSDEIPPSLRERAITVTEAKYAETNDAFERLKTLRFLQKLGVKQTPERMKTELDGLDKKQLEAGNVGPTKWALDELRESDPQWVSEWLARKFLEGSTRFGGWNEMVSQIPSGERDRLLERFTNEFLDANEKHRVLSILATTADGGVAARVFERACEIRRELMIGPSRDMAKWNFFRQQQDLLQAIAPKIILDALSPKLERDPEETELGLLTDVLGRLSPTRTDTRTALPDEARRKLYAYLKRAVERAADPHGVSASGRADLAVLLAQVGGPSDIPDLRRLITADTIRYREMQAARRKGDRSGDNVGYVIPYMNAVMTADPEHGDEVLLEMLSEEQYERFVAEELVRRAKKSQGQPTLGIRPPAFEKVWAAREGKETEEYVEERRTRYAHALWALVEKILAERAAATDKRHAEHRLKPIGTSLAALDARRSANLILEVMAFPAGYDAYNRVESLQSLIFAGIRMTLAEMINVLGPAIEQARRDLGNSDQNRWLLDRCLSILAFVDPEEGIAKIKEILAQVRFFYPHDSRGVVAALGASRCGDAMDLLLELAKPDGSAVAQIGEEWIRAVAQLGGNRSNEVLLSFVDPDQKLFTKEFVPDYQHGNVFAGLLADRAEHDSEFKAELFRLADGELPPTKRMLLAKTFSRFQREDDLVVGLCVLRDDTSEVPFELLQSIENAFLERRPCGTDGSVHTLAPRGSNALRKRLFEMAQTDPVRKRSAFALLGQIEVWRLEHGRPMDEPRHPSIESGAYWPI
ncbi:MAG: NACHT domain-containing protein [Terriglobales bacterium]